MQCSKHTQTAKGKKVIWQLWSDWAIIRKHAKNKAFHKKLSPIHPTLFKMERQIYLCVIYPEPSALHIFYVWHIMSRKRCILCIQMYNNGIKHVKGRSVTSSSHKWHHIQHFRESDTFIYFSIPSLLIKQNPKLNNPANQIMINLR